MPGHRLHGAVRGGKGVQGNVHKDQAQAAARGAMAWLTQRDIPPTPETFEIAYSLPCNAHAERKQTVNALTAGGAKLDADALSNIHHSFFRAPKNEAIMEELGE